MVGTFSDSKIVAHCPDCNAEGVAWKLKGDIVEMRCPRCFAQWKTTSARCSHCYKPNGTAKPGFCKQCREKRGA